MAPYDYTSLLLESNQRHRKRSSAEMHNATYEERKRSRSSPEGMDAVSLGWSNTQPVIPMDDRLLEDLGSDQERSLISPEIHFLVSSMVHDFFEELTLMWHLTEEHCVAGGCCESRALDVLMERLAVLRDDERLFPSSMQAIVNPTIVPRIEQMFMGMLRVYVHLYQYHYQDIAALAASEHLNTCCTRLLMFVSEIHLIDTEVLANLQKIFAATVTSCC